MPGQENARSRKNVQRKTGKVNSVRDIKEMKVKRDHNRKLGSHGTKIMETERGKLNEGEEYGREN